MFKTSYDSFDADSLASSVRMLRPVVDKDGVPTGELEADPGVTQQSFRDEVDINEIVRRFGLTGSLPENFRPPMVGDFTNVVDFQSALNAVIAAREAFEQMPGELRARFANDPQRLIDFLGDEKNRDEALKLGLLEKPPERTRDVVQAVDELAAKLVKPA